MKENNFFIGSFCSVRDNITQKKFGSVTGKDVKVAVIDSGWDRTLKDIRILEGKCFCDENDELKLGESFNYNDVNGHGTAVTSVILQIAPDINILPIKVFGKRLETSINIIEAGIYFAIENEVNLINLSLGTFLEEALIPLYKACEAAKSKNITIIASRSNLKEDSYPSIFENVISVGIGNSTNPFDFNYTPDEYVECLAWGKDRFMNSLKGEHKMLSGTSFATPNITGICALLTEKYGKMELDKLRALLKEYQK
jgi:subtilisin